MYDPTIGRWLTEDPIGFEGEDANLYRYVGNRPTNATDPSGLKVWISTGPDTIIEGKEALEEFFKQLGDQGPKPVGVALPALKAQPKFREIWDYLLKVEWDIELKVVPGLKHPTTGNPVYGGFSRTEFKLNPTMPQVRANPMELLDTLIHESIHAAFVAREKSSDGDVGFPLGKDVRDISHDPFLKAKKIGSTTGLNIKDISLDPALKDYADKNYGDFAPKGTPPRTTYVDINKPAQELIVTILTDLLKQKPIRDIPILKPTSTFGNVDLMNMRIMK
ncbi:MAG: RHS repeat-associated core domain-containing protein [Gemmataceae bacterium]